MIEPRSNSPARCWHAVFCKPQQDERAEVNLLNQGYEIFRPKTRVRRTRNGRRRVVLESMFPRYLFARLSQSGEDWAPIRSTRGAIGLVRLGLETPIVPTPVIDALRQRCDADGIINLAGTIDYQPNDPVEIIDGPCAGYRALFQSRSSEERVIVLLKLLQHERKVELADTAIRRA
jgi:transcriptional antiterminator RfaH